MASIKNIMPPPNDMLREIIIVTVGMLGAAFFISRFPKVKAFVQDNSITVKDPVGNVYYG